MRRRDAMSVLALLTFSAACGGPSRGVRVVAIWSGWELAQFHRILAAFPQRGTWKVSVLSAGNDMGPVLDNHVARTAAPDVALVGQPQLVGEHVRRLVPIGPVQGQPEGWTDLLRFADGQVYGTWFKAAHKSVVWYRPDLLPRVPGKWDDWVALCREMAAQGRPPLAIGAADGWVLTDWFENVLLSLDPDTYQGLAAGRVPWTHPSVAAALSRLAEVWTIRGVFAGGPRHALLTQFDGAVVDVFQHGRAAMMPGGDFCYPFIRQYGSADARWFRFPAAAGGRLPLVVGGDAAVLLRPGSAGGRQLIEWLTAPEAAEIWVRQGGFLSLDPRVHGYPAPLAELARELIDETARDPAFDLSDRLGGRLVGGDGRGSWKIFQDFFTAVAERPAAVPGAIRAAVRAFDRAARGALS